MILRDFEGADAFILQPAQDRAAGVALLVYALMTEDEELSAELIKISGLELDQDTDKSVFNKIQILKKIAETI